MAIEDALATWLCNQRWFAGKGQGLRDLAIVATAPDHSMPQPYRRTPFNESWGRLSYESSPRWVAYLASPALTMIVNWPALLKR